MTHTPVPTMAEAPRRREDEGLSEVVRREEQRVSPREPLTMMAHLLPLGAAAPIRCRTDNIGEGGLHVTAPIGYGLAVGQRYEVLLTALDPPASDDDLRGDGHFATVVRTEMHVGASEDHLGVGLRFDQPLVL
jgi:hypothetical protein